MSDQPSYYSIITANVRYDNRLTDSEKLLFAEITSLSNKYGYCTASNGYFAKLYEVTKVTVSRRIANLKECGYLQVEIIREGNEIKQRKIYPLTQMIIPINTNDNTPINNSVNTPIITNVKENNTSINITRLNNTSSNSNSATDVTLAHFEEWWTLYDKKLDRKKAFSLFKSALKKHGFETIMNGTREYLKTITNKQYQKYPKTFLSQESYLNDFTIEKQESGMDQLERMKYDESYWD
ncbi:TPA: helix-turn-helix domain-containing protein [Staphylococcus pseudintermedius]|uniref:helix-turn-helix domain-containing protein n=1 Tax=Staphylococcus pseudintermedius TaxID=283734 RepID=UPI0019F67B28|nr:helix-turn-helix domain-containing protein [Staphylococcus pseudintermedius]EGQ4361606.1 helix-turn-helix domain-containing protein [Staphylococcus pseudintermedius]EJL7989864.1 helix-turn-helix domain-containing protein [Staphylococcus pseudintermedius]MDT0875978.1 helix-turn-helix domain-containing protein [Staphylococcus pseudintermedius]MDT0902387.1 helix-turn-helix domain-containing protein [Staphylococcus pseudintermedius]HCT0547565.1 helix-turn-helix domain-containing protein [Staphy